MNTVRLSDISEKIDYGVTASANQNPIGPKFLRITDIQDGSVDWTTVPHCEADYRKLASSRLHAGDIVFARTGATTGKSYLIRSCPNNAVFASYLIRVQPNPRVDSIFLSHFFDSPDYWRQISLKTAGAAQPGVNASKLEELEVPLPSLPEQRRIAAILDQADALRAKRRAALAHLDEMAQAIFDDMFGDENNIAQQWTMVDLDQVLTFLTSGSRGWACHYSKEGDLFLRIQNVRRDELCLEDVTYVKAPQTAEARRTRIQAGDVLLSITADLGRTAVVPEHIGIAYINQHLAILRQEKFDPRFLSRFLSSINGQEQIKRLNKGGVKAGLNFNDVRSIQVPTPPRAMQDAYAERCDQLSRVQACGRADAYKLDTLFASLQHRAFTGAL